MGDSGSSCMGVAGTQDFSSMFPQLMALWMEIGDGLEGLCLTTADELRCRIRPFWEDAESMLSWLRLGLSSSCGKFSVDLSLVMLRLLGLMAAAGSAYGAVDISLREGALLVFTTLNIDRLNTIHQLLHFVLHLESIIAESILQEARQCHFTTCMYSQMTQGCYIASSLSTQHSSQLINTVSASLLQLDLMQLTSLFLSDVEQCLI